VLGLSRALQLAEDTVARFHQVLGEDHPDTVLSVNNLAAALRALFFCDVIV
jgi:hypothetical protein